MTQTIAIEKLTLSAVEERFSMQPSTDERFFEEWQTNLPELTAFEKERVERIEAIYKNIERRPVLESSVNMAIVGPLLDAAGLFLPPFYLETEKTVEIVAEDQGAKLRGRLDTLIIRDFLWVLTIESKQAGFSLRVGIPQVLAYMLAAPKEQETLYGMVTNGRSFVFLKLKRGKTTRYARSKEFLIDQDAGLEQTLKIIKKLSRAEHGAVGR
ncbi:restriction endonuclease subunit R [cf. Phormidesmis sp. LEGE 11477]|uniref:restriction endonuclease subunit R n=1 Tax=cf. Phormidesmis sp. LEGE 11477 TaxID=1828680 RepID=UPI0018831062|nr:restriction endonuclease subunit R [cf. Phormidesmis sp. LEGE 11477]MBE9059957.1 restriction endonuclease subunit R [cf. Phormidesmis sp. LEGE 11477]